MMSTPMVMMATENSGSPTIGLMKTVSTISPTTAGRDHRKKRRERPASPHRQIGEVSAGKVEHRGNEAVRKAPDRGERRRGRS